MTTPGDSSVTPSAAAAAGTAGTTGTRIQAAAEPAAYGQRLLVIYGALMLAMLLAAAGPYFFFKWKNWL